VTSGVAALIPAAGRGSRLAGAGVQASPKALRVLAGRSLLEWSLAALSPFADSLVVAVPAAYVDSTRAALSHSGTVTVLAGGSTRQESVRLALARVGSGVEHVLVHDAARPLTPLELTARVLDALRGGAAAAVPVVPVADSLRRVSSDGASAAVARSAFRAVQTPQGFRREVLARAHEEFADGEAFDDATLVELVGVPVTLVEGSDLAFKVTRPIDLLLAEAVLAAGGEEAQP
jgi:2-C-methyl-D-erythritol 4-phosphate cytidylyltransferase